MLHTRVVGGKAYSLAQRYGSKARMLGRAQVARLKAGMVMVVVVEGQRAFKVFLSLAGGQLASDVVALAVNVGYNEVRQ